MKLITGMHRSGTSMMARLCLEAGGDLGDPETFYQGDQWNPDGYFEQPDIHQVNMPLVNGPFGKLSYFKLPSTKRILARSDKYKGLIQEFDAKYMGKIVKETRFCLTIPGWEKHGATFEKVLICLRSPIQVANSIKKRNKTIINHGLNLWYTHNVRLLENIGNTPFWFVSYNNLLNEETSFQELKSALNFLDLHPSDDEIMNLKTTYIKTKLNNNPDQPYNYPEKVAHLWSKLQEMQKLQQPTYNN